MKDIKKLVCILIFLVSTSVFSQSDSLKYSQLDNLTSEQLLQYYINEPEPYPYSKGPEHVGDSTYNILNPLTIPTETVNADPLLHFSFDGLTETTDTMNRIAQRMRPKIAFGAGRMGYNGDLYSHHFQSPLTSRWGFDMAISQRLTRYLQVNFNVLFGKLGANEWRNNRQENFQSEIRAGGLNLIYDFGNFIPDKCTVRPFVSIGVMGFEFLSKTDLKDKNGNTYYYWSDGSIKDKAQGSPDAQNAKNLVRDYKYETDIRESNKDGFGKYQERAIAVPLGVGVLMKVTDRIDLKLNFQYYFTSTDYIDGITNKSIGDRVGNKHKDNFTYSSVSLQYDLISKPKRKPFADTLSNSFWLAFDKSDEDHDGVEDLKDDCLGTEPGAKVDEKGCPIDDDKDGIPNYRDDELNTPPGLPVDDRGVAQTDDYWKNWYARYLNDSLDANVTTEIVGNIYDLTSKKPKKKKDNKDIYTVELVRYNGSIPTDELAPLLSIGDINSKTLDDGTTVVYTNSQYENLQAAVKRRDEFRAEGNKGAGISKIKGNDIIPVSDEELESLLKQEIEDLMKLNIGNKSDSTQTASSISKEGKDNVRGNDGTVNKDGTIGKDGKQGAEEIPDKQGTVGKNGKDEISGKDNAIGKYDNLKGDDDNSASNAETFSKDDIVYRVQLGAFRNRISTSVFNTSAGTVLELKTGENIYRYVTTGYKTIGHAASVRADLVIQGYSDAFVTAYKDGKRIPLSQTKATVDKEYKEDLNENKIFSSVDKNLVAFKVQLGPLKKPALEKSMDDRVKSITDTEKQITTSGSIRYTSGSFTTQEAAEKYRKELESKGISDAFVIATFKNEVISIQEATELMK